MNRDYNIMQAQRMNILTIGGSDPSAGAGIQSDLKTFDQLDCYGLCVVTAMTSQNTSGFFKYETASSKIVSSQLKAVLEDFKIGAIKVSMVTSKPIIKTIYERLEGIDIPVIIDPVMKSTTGGNLMDSDSLENYKKYLVPIAHAITPNTFEACVLTGIKIKNKESLVKSAKVLKGIGVKNVIITGFEISENRIADIVFSNNKYSIISTKKIQNTNHGSGCNYSAALTVALAKKKNIFTAAHFAKQFAVDSIKNSRKVGKGIAITNYVKEEKLDEVGTDLQDAITKFTKIRNANMLIPECQTNFVYSKNSPSTLNEVMGILGRIVKTGNSVTVAGKLKYGSSKHVATAVLAINKKFPEIRSAVNIKYDRSLIKTIKKIGYHTSYYDRTKEPESVKRQHSSIFWGVRQATNGLKIPPDAVYHTGDFGKEPMIIIFGRDPHYVVTKVRKIARAHFS